MYYHSPEQDFTFLGNFLIDAGQYMNAAALLTQVINLSFGKNDYDLIVSAASAYRQATLYDKAEEYYKKAVKLKPNVSCYLQYSNFLIFLETLKVLWFLSKYFHSVFNCFWSQCGKSFIIRHSAHAQLWVLLSQAIIATTYLINS